MTVHLDTYDDFWKHYRALERKQREALGSFLCKLQAVGPYEPDIQRACEAYSDERYAFEYSPGHTIFWKVIEYEQKRLITPSQEDTIFIAITALGTLKPAHA